MHGASAGSQLRIHSTDVTKSQNFVSCESKFWDLRSLFISTILCRVVPSRIYCSILFPNKLERNSAPEQTADPYAVSTANCGALKSCVHINFFDFPGRAKAADRRKVFFSQKFLSLW